MPERVHKVLARAGIGSLRACEDLIRAGRVRVGEEIASIGMLVEPDRDDICVDGKRLQRRAVRKHYFLLYKPRGYVSTARDPQGRPRVTDLIPLPGVRLYPVGRLDMETSGLLLLTNDGELTYLLTHPRHEIRKIYEVLVQGIPSTEDIARLQQGVALPEGRTAPARVKVLRELASTALLKIEIHEGKKRQVRRMCAAVGHPVLELKRVGLAFLTLQGLQPGQYRQLTPDEVRSLKKMAASGSRNRVPQRGSRNRAPRPTARFPE